MLRYLTGVFRVVVRGGEEGGEEVRWRDDTYWSIECKKE